MNWPWSGLGLSGPADLRSVREAYAQRLKTTHPEEDPEGFQRLHAAYQEASRHARRAARAAQDGGEAEKPPEPKAVREFGERPQEQPAEEPEAADWNCEELLEDQPSSPKPPEETQKPEEPGWDYERLFAEGEAEAREARRRKLEELRGKNRARYTAQEREQRRRAADEEELWSAVMAAAHALELLYSTGAPPYQWRRFLNDPVFWNVRANLDFVFALEDFLEQRPDLSPDIRKAIFSAYEFEKGPGYPVYRRLYRLLDVDRRDKRRMAKSKSAWRNAWRSYPLWRKAVIVVCFTIFAAFFLLAAGLSARDTYRNFIEKRAAQEWEAHILEYLEEDFGEPFALAVRDNIYAPVSDPDCYFWVTRDGERTEDWPGYRTDYPHILVMRAMQDFAEERELGLKLDGAGGFRGNIGDAPGAYLFDLPLLGAEEAVPALGGLVEELRSQSWYRLFEDQYGGRIEYQIFLCHSGLSFYDAVSTRDGGFDAETALDRYGQAGCAYCRYILENSGLAARHMGEDAYELAGRGTVEAGGGTFFWVTGVNGEDHSPLAEYLLASGGGMLFCLPAGQVEGINGMMDLYRGSPSHIQLDQVGLVMVWDQIKTE